MEHGPADRRTVVSRAAICDALNAKGKHLSCVASVDAASGDVLVRYSPDRWCDNKAALQAWRKIIHIEVARLAQGEWLSVKQFTHCSMVSRSCKTCGAESCVIICPCGCSMPIACPKKTGGGRCKPAYRKFFAAVLVCPASRVPNKKALKANVKRVNQTAALAVLMARRRGNHTIFGRLPVDVLLLILSFVTEPFGLYRRIYPKCAHNP